MVGVGTYALVHLLRFLAHITPDTCLFDLSVGHEGLKELLFSWTCHTLPTQVIVTRIHASEEKLMASVDLSMARVAVKNASIGL